MRALTDIDIAFLPMNLPYTMTIEQAADAVAAIKPGEVYPYHSKGSDIEAFAGARRGEGAGHRGPDPQLVSERLTDAAHRLGATVGTGIQAGHVSAAA